jgi:hypothetical protein
MLLLINVKCKVTSNSEERLLIRPCKIPCPPSQALTPICIEFEVVAANNAVFCGLVSIHSFKENRPDGP